MPDRPTVRIESPVRKDNSLPEKKGIIHHTRKGRARDASIEIATCRWPKDVTTYISNVLLRTFVLEV